MLRRGKEYVYISMVEQLTQSNGERRTFALSVKVPLKGRVVTTHTADEVNVCNKGEGGSSIRHNVNLHVPTRPIDVERRVRHRRVDDIVRAIPLPSLVDVGSPRSISDGASASLHEACLQGGMGCRWGTRRTHRSGVARSTEITQEQCTSRGRR